MASSSFPLHRTKYDVFISFRGQDIRSTFLSHLHKQLEHNQVDVYVDDRLRAGDNISLALLEAIEESLISLVIFSEDYASSKWCLDELVHIIQCMEQDQRIVIPVFYNVDPSSVRHQKRTFEEAFLKHQEKYKEEMVKMQSWRSALNKAANLSGFHYPSTYRNESELIEDIVKDISKKLSDANLPYESQDLVGIDENFGCIEQLLEVESGNVRIIGIWGMGGLGKTTIAQAVFDKYSSQYDGRCFLKNIREESQKHGLSYLCQKLDSELLQAQVGERSTYVKRRLSRKKVFIVLDDVDTLEQLSLLIGVPLCFGPSSRVIVTTRDKQIISKIAHAICEVKELNFQNSLQLFNFNAFGQINPGTGYEEIATRAVDYASGVPLALKVLGSFLYSKSIEVWASELRKLRICPNRDIFNVLKLSYDGLDELEKNIFLDIAFFFKGDGKDNVTRFLDSCGFFGDVGIDSLQRKALITISRDDNRIGMHDLIEEMGREIVRQESVKNPERRSRLRNPKDVYNLLKNNQGTDLIEGIMLDLSQTKDLHLHADTFKQMPRLRFLKFFHPSNERSSSLNVYAPTFFESFSDELRHLEWHGFPLKSMPSTFCAEQLVVLHLQDSPISKLWDGIQDMVNLNEINLLGCDQLVELPDFSKASNLKRMFLILCSSLYRIHPSILSLNTLEVLYLSLSEEPMKNLKGNINLESLHHLYLQGHGKTSMVSGETIIDRLCFSFTGFNKLTRFELENVEITSLPNELCSVTSLEDLLLWHCQYLTELPHNMKALTRLRFLLIRGCHRLQSLPELPLSVTCLRVENCQSLEKVVISKSMISSVKRDIRFINCKRLNEHSLNVITEDTHLTMVAAAALNHLLATRRENLDKYPDFFGVLDPAEGAKVCYTGSKVPEWFRFHMRQSITFELQQPHHHLLGFFLYCLLDPSDTPFFDIQCHCYLGDDGARDNYVDSWYYPSSSLLTESDHVFVWYSPLFCARIMEGVEICRANDHCASLNQKISFQFIAQPSIKACGVHPIYVSDMPNFIQKMQVESGFDDESKQYHEFLLDEFEDERRTPSPSKQHI